MEDPKLQQWKYSNYSSFIDDGASYQGDVKMTKSGPDIRLTEMEQQLEVAETRCGSLKSQLDYMKMLYQGVQPSSPESIESIAQSPFKDSDQQKKVGQQLPLKDNKFTTKDENRSDKSANEDVKYYKCLEEIHRMQEITKEDADLEIISPRQFSRSSKTTPRVIDQHNSLPLEEEHESISAEYRHTKQIRKTYTFLGAATDEEASSDPMAILMSAPAASISPRISDVGKEHEIDDVTAIKNPYQHFTEYPACLQHNLTAVASTDLTNQSLSEDKYESGQKSVMLQQNKKETKKQELVLKLSESMNNTPIVKQKKVPKFDKKQRTCLGISSGIKKSLHSKHDDTLSVTSKSKRKKGKLRNATSKSAVTTRETNLTDRRDSKKRKHRGYLSATHVPRQPQVPIQHLPRIRAEIVELYHNNALERGSGSVSVSSSKHFKHEAHNQLRLGNNMLAKPESSAQMCSTAVYQPQQHQESTQQQQNCTSGQKFTQEQKDARALARSNNQGYQKYLLESQKSRNNYTIENSNEETMQCNSAPHPSRYYDPMITRNYELPTVSSKLKKVNRSYFNRFNFRNIPFVVSTSVTPSHNLGLNIQQVLSIMKTKQPMTTGMTPLLIRKMNKGIKPAIALLDQVNDPYILKSLKSSVLDRQSDHVSSVEPKTEYVTSAVDDSNKLKYPNSRMFDEHTITQGNKNFDGKRIKNFLLEEDEEQESGCICCPKKSKSYNKMLKQYTSRKSIMGNPTLTASALLRERQEEINIGDNQYNTIKSGSGNAKGIREVLINLHDQFEELNTTYEKLQEKAAKSQDTSITKQIAAMEKELNAKEHEINAVVGLYKEVLYLKQQVQSIHGRNSFVCITTSDDPSNPAVVVPRSGFTRAQVTNPMQICGTRSKGPASNVREPATSTRLAGLLREIQSFQKQLLSL